jgi:predicted ester cyclase
MKEKPMRPREVVEACQAAWQKRDLETAAKLTSPNLVEHSPVLVAQAHRLSEQGAKKSAHPPVEDIKKFLQVFPDAKVKIEDIFESGNKVVYRWKGTGTHKGDFLGIKATNKKVTVEGMTIARVENDQIVETWRQFDLIGAMAQLGWESKVLRVLRPVGSPEAKY